MLRIMLTLLLFSAACAAFPEGPTATSETIRPDCSTVLGDMTEENTLTCHGTPRAGMLLQSQGEQTTITTGGVHITLDGTLYMTFVADEALTVATLEGVGIVGALGAARIVQPGAQVTISLTGMRAAQPPDTPVPFDVRRLADAPVASLARPIQLPEPIAPPPGYVAPTPSTKPAPSPTTAPEECVVREDWTGRHTVQRGETLSQIARQYDLTLEELQSGNCISNPDRIFSGQSLRLPPGVVTPRPAEGGPTATPSAVFFRTDNPSIVPGQCTTLRWDVDNVSSVTFAGETTDGHNARQVCPSETTTYTLQVVYPDGDQSNHTVTITVTDD